MEVQQISEICFFGKKCKIGEIVDAKIGRSGYSPRETFNREAGAVYKFPFS